MEVVDIVYDLFQPGKNSKAGIIRIFPVKNIKYGKRVSISGSEIPVRHGHLVKVHHHGQVSDLVLFFHESLSPSALQLKLRHGAQLEQVCRMAFLYFLLNFLILTEPGQNQCIKLFIGKAECVFICSIRQPVSGYFFHEFRRKSKCFTDFFYFWISFISATVRFASGEKSPAASPKMVE